MVINPVEDKFNYPRFNELIVPLYRPTPQNGQTPKCVRTFCGVGAKGVHHKNDKSYLG